MIGAMAERLCPKCGAYWRCECALDDLPAGQAGAALSLPVDPSCGHEWADAVGVELDGDLGLYDAKVVVCRLCGLYAVEESARG